jgi:hypothetical protein
VGCLFLVGGLFYGYGGLVAVFPVVVGESFQIWSLALSWWWVAFVVICSRFGGRWRFLCCGGDLQRSAFLGGGES